MGLLEPVRLPAVAEVLLAALCSGASAGTVSLQCRFDTAPAAASLETPPLVFRLSYDRTQETARREDPLGARLLTPLFGAAGEVTLVELTATATIVVTTVVPGGEAVHSTHVVSGGAVHATQRRGTCLR